MKDKSFRMSRTPQFTQDHCDKAIFALRGNPFVTFLGFACPLKVVVAFQALPRTHFYKLLEDVVRRELGGLVGSVPEGDGHDASLPVLLTLRVAPDT
jgi:hypothetical protein